MIGITHGLVHYKYRFEKYRNSLLSSYSSAHHLTSWNPAPSFSSMHGLFPASPLHTLTLSGETNSSIDPMVYLTARPQVSRGLIGPQTCSGCDHVSSSTRIVADAWWLFITLSWAPYKFSLSLTFSLLCFVFCGVDFSINISSINKLQICRYHKQLSISFQQICVRQRITSSTWILILHTELHHLQTL